MCYNVCFFSCKVPKPHVDLHCCNSDHMGFSLIVLCFDGLVTTQRLDLPTLLLLQDAKAALETLANSYKPDDIGKHCYHLYEQFRPNIASGLKGWGKKGQLDLVQIRHLAEQH